MAFIVVVFFVAVNSVSQFKLATVAGRHTRGETKRAKLNSNLEYLAAAAAKLRIATGICERKSTFIRLHCILVALAHLGARKVLKFIHNLVVVSWCP